MDAFQGYAMLDEVVGSSFPYFVETWHEHALTDGEFRKMVTEALAAARVGQFIYNVAHR